MELLMPQEQEEYRKLGYWKNKNLYSYLEEFAQKFPEITAVVDHSNRYTYSMFLNRVQKMAGALINHGVKQGDVVSFQLPNWSEAVILYKAVQMIGAINNPIIPFYRKKELEYILNRSNSKIFVFPHKFRNFNYLDMVRNLENVDHLKQFIVLDRYNEKPVLESGKEILYSTFIESGYVHKDVCPVDEKSIALLMYTSGTTSMPKGVIHSHNTLDIMTARIDHLYNLNSQDVFFAPGPISHITGLICGVELPLMVGSKAVYLDIWNSKEAIELILNEDVTWSIGAPPFIKGITAELEKIESERQKKLKINSYLVGGADVHPELILEASRALNCFVGRIYGSTEGGIVTITSAADTIENAAYTDGKALKDTIIKIVDENYVELPRGEVGELAVKAPERFLGYLQTEFNRDSFTEDGFFLTGDLALMDSEGYVEIKARKKDIIIRGGENLSVKEVEDILYQHPSIADIAIVAMPDEVMGEKACAYVVLKEGTEFSFSEMISFLSQNELAKLKYPERLEIINEMPRNPSGKIQKFKLREDIKNKLTI